MSSPLALHLFDAVGIELEYMIVDRDSLDVRPIADQLLAAEAGRITGDVTRGGCTWSNELAAHVIELKTAEPAPSLEGLADLFAGEVRHINRLLEPLHARLLPTAMHPWMDPLRETRLWPHEYNAVYETFNRLFDCRGHGWSNLQSMHINLPFADDAEFAQLHAAARLLLPILPALAAGSPIMDGRLTGVMDNRLDVYRANSARIPSLTGAVIPEPVFSMQEYHDRILAPIYRDLAPFDPEGVVQHEWANARGAIARFERNTIEIRVLDMQECPAADLAIAARVIETLRALTQQRWCDLAAQQAWPVAPLARVFLAAIKDAEQAVIDDADYLRCFGFTAAPHCTAAALWRHIAADLGQSAPSNFLGAGRPELDSLARRIAAVAGPDATPDRLHRVFSRLAECLQSNESFEA